MSESFIQPYSLLRHFSQLRNKLFRMRGTIRNEISKDEWKVHLHILVVLMNISLWEQRDYYRMFCYRMINVNVKGCFKDQIQGTRQRAIKNVNNCQETQEIDEKFTYSYVLENEEETMCFGILSILRLQDNNCNWQLLYYKLLTERGINEQRLSRRILVSFPKMLPEVYSECLYKHKNIDIQFGFQK